MGHDATKEKRASRVLRFAVSGALMVAPLTACGSSAQEEEPEVYETTNVGSAGEEEEEPQVNEVVEEPAAEETGEEASEE